MEVVCNANLPRPERLVSLQAEKTVGKIFTERPSGSGATAAAVVPPAGQPAGSEGRAPESPRGGLWKVLPGGNIHGGGRGKKGSYLRGG